MYSCYFTCPFCDLNFEVRDISIDEDIVNCKYCDQEFSVELEVEITSEVTECTHGEEYEEKRKIATGIKEDMFVIHFGEAENSYHVSCYGHAENDYKNAKLFPTEKEALSVINSYYKTKFPNAKPIKYKHCETIEYESKHIGLFEGAKK